MPVCCKNGSQPILIPLVIRIPLKSAPDSKSIKMIISAAASIEINKQALNELNVFPVPDGDTGTNMAMTINAAAADLRKTEDPTLEKAAATALWT